MVQKYVVELLDDLDGSPASDTVEFALDGVSYAIDLSDEHVNELRSTLDPYVAAARRADQDGKRARTATSSGSSSSPKRTDLAAVREWANANGHAVSSRGRIPQTVLDAYDAR